MYQKAKTEKKERRNKVIVKKNKYAKRLRLFILILIISIIGVAFYFYYNRDKAVSLIIPDLNEINAISLNIKDGNTLAKIDVIVENERPYRMVIDSLVCILQLDEKTLIEERIPLKLNLPNYSRDTIAVPFHFNIGKVKEMISRLQTKDSTDLHVTGYIIYSTFIGKTRLPFTKKIKIDVPNSSRVKSIECRTQKV